MKIFETLGEVSFKPIAKLPLCNDVFRVAGIGPTSFPPRMRTAKLHLSLGTAKRESGILKLDTRFAQRASAA